MKENKILPIVIIGALCVVLVLIIIFGVSLFSDKEKGGTESKQDNEELIAPVIELSLNTNDEEQEEVTISAVATTEDEEGIDYIELPDKTQIFADSKEYTVTENGKYTFKAVGVNGAESTVDIEVTNIRQISANNPYIPEGFEHIGGEVDTGYVIQDSYGNQYVWIPVPTGILTRSTMMSTDYSESNSSATALVNSVAKNYGFYIARFEASSYEQGEQKVAASMAEKMPWTEVTFREAEAAATASAEVFGYDENTATALLSSYAWDTTLEWINKTVTNYSTNTSYGNYSGTIYPTGTTESDQMNYICDLAGNVREWTTEEYNPITTDTKKSSSKKKNTDENVSSRVIRGGSANLNKIANSRNGYPEDLTDGYWGFRTVLFAK